MRAAPDGRSHPPEPGPRPTGEPGRPPTGDSGTGGGSPAPAGGPSGGDAARPEGADRSDEGGAGTLPSLWARALRVFVAPGRLFAELRERPAWLGVLVLVVGVGVAGALLVPEELFRDFLRAQMPPDAPAGAVESQLDLQVRLRFLGPLLWFPFAAAASAGLLLFIYNLLLGDEATYRQLMAVTSHALLIPAVGEVITLPLRIRTGSFETTLSLHLLAPGLEEGFPLYFLQGLNVFALWAAVVVGIGVARVYPRRATGSAVSVVLGIFLAFAAGGAALRAAFAA